MKPIDLRAQAHDLLDDAIQLRRRIHRQPELGLSLPKTQTAVLEAIDGLGLDVKTGTSTTSVVATLTGAKPGPTILLRGDMDALPMPEDTGLPFASEIPGRMHACGHDSHVAMLAGAARLLSRHRDAMAGNVLFMFQPGEEGYHGARHMIEEGLLDGAHAPSGAFAIHITERGETGHASAPHMCLDPIPVACEIVQALQALVTRRISVFDPAVVSITKIEAGTTRNVIPESATLLGTVRTVSEATREKALEGVRRVAEGVASAHGAQVTVDITRGYPVTVNDEGFAGFVFDTARALLGPDFAHQSRHPIMASEDFSYVLQRVPGAMANLCTRPESGPAYPTHSTRMTLNESAMANGIAMHAAVALRFLSLGGKLTP